jgi:hypothetical protein
MNDTAGELVPPKKFSSLVKEETGFRIPECRERKSEKEGNSKKIEFAGNIIYRW